MTARDKTRITASDMKFMRQMAECVQSTATETRTRYWKKIWNKAPTKLNIL